MDDSTTPGKTPPVSVPNPHSDAPAPTPQSGMRPEAAADPSVRPEQDEPGGPLAGLVGTAASQAASEAAPASADSALLENMGVESEGIESGQLLGLVAATIVAIAALAVVLIFLFYLPYRQQVGTTSSNVSQYPELEQVRTEAAAKLNQYARADSVYHVPIGQAMSVVAARYAQTGAAPAGLPSTRQQWNTLMLNRGTGTSVQNPAGLTRRTTVEQERLSADSEGEAGAARTAPGTPVSSTTGAETTGTANAPAMPRRTAGTTNEEVGVDGTPQPAVRSTPTPVR